VPVVPIYPTIQPQNEIIFHPDLAPGKRRLRLLTGTFAPSFNEDCVAPHAAQLRNPDALSDATKSALPMECQTGAIFRKNIC
jgi:hypothetical protein